MSDTNREVTITVGAKLKAGDPFARLAEQAGKMTSAVQDRLKEVHHHLEELTTFKGLAKQGLAEALEISEADKAIGKLTTRVRDNLGRLKREAGTFTIHADPGPMLATLRRIQADALQVQRTVKGLGVAGFGGLGRAAGGAQDIARGAMFLSGESEELDRVFKRIIEFQGIVDILRGSKEMLVGLVGGLANLGKAAQGIGAAASLSKELAAAEEAVTAALSQEAAAQTAETAASARAIEVNAVLAESHLEVAAAVRARTIAQEEAAAIGSATARGAMAGWGRRALLGGGVGAAAGQIAGAAGIGTGSRLLDTAIGVGGGAALGAALPKIGAALGAVGTSIGASGGAGAIAAGAGMVLLPLIGLGAATSGALAGLSPKQSTRLWQFATGGTAFRGVGTHDAEDYEQAIRRRREEAEGNQDARTERMVEQRELHRKLSKVAGSLGVNIMPDHIEEDWQRRYDVRHPIEERKRQLRDRGAAFNDEVEGWGIQDERYFQSRNIDKQQEKFREALQRSLDIHEGPAGIAKATAEANRMESVFGAEHDGSAESEAGLLKARRELVRAKSEELRISKELARAETESGHTLNEQLALAHELEEAQQRSLEATENQARAERDQSVAERERLERQRQFWHESAQFYKQQAQHIRDQQQDARVSLGLASPSERAELLLISRKLDQGLRPGHDQRMMLVNGRPQINPATSTALTDHERAVIRANPQYFGERERAVGLQAYERYRAEIDEIQKESRGKLGRAEAGQNLASKKEVALEQKIENININVDVHSLAKDAAKQVAAAIEPLMSTLEKRLRLEMVQLILSETRKTEEFKKTGRSAISGPS